MEVKEMSHYSLILEDSVLLPLYCGIQNALQNEIKNCLVRPHASIIKFVPQKKLVIPLGMTAFQKMFSVICCISLKKWD
jgi:uracil-DNA glycosylase